MTKVHLQSLLRCIYHVKSTAGLLLSFVFLTKFISLMAKKPVVNFYQLCFLLISNLSFQKYCCVLLSIVFMTYQKSLMAKVLLVYFYPQCFLHIIVSHIILKKKNLVYFYPMCFFNNKVYLIQKSSKSQQCLLLISNYTYVCHVKIPVDVLLSIVFIINLKSLMAKVLLVYFYPQCFLLISNLSCQKYCCCTFIHSVYY